MTKYGLEMFDALKWKMDCMTISFGKKRLYSKTNLLHSKEIKVLSASKWVQNFYV